MRLWEQFHEIVHCWTTFTKTRGYKNQKQHLKKKIPGFLEIIHSYFLQNLIICMITHLNDCGKNDWLLLNSRNYIWSEAIKIHICMILNRIHHLFLPLFRMKWNFISIIHCCYLAIWNMLYIRNCDS